MENIIMVGVGIILFFFGYMIAFRKKINLVHSYHYKRVADKDIDVFCKYVGYGNFVVGIGMITFPVIIAVFGETAALSVSGIFIVAGLVLSLYTIVKYNKGLF